MMKEAIEGFFQQFKFEPKMANAERLGNFRKFLVAGMGGSHFAADFILAADPSLDVVIHNDYGLPGLSDENMKDRLVVCSSYSGNTEEVLSAFEEARERGLPTAVLTVGGKLLEAARASKTPYVLMPDTGIQPRSALGFGFRGFAAILGREDILKESVKLSALRAEDFRDKGEKLASDIKGFTPVIYSSTGNRALAFNWKIGFNETAKIPAFFNIFPELNHNEMTGFDVTDATKNLSEKIVFIFLEDDHDYPKVRFRMVVTKKLYEDRGFRVFSEPFSGVSRLERIFISSIIADWTAYSLGEIYGVDTEQVPMVEEFKLMIS